MKRNYINEFYHRSAIHYIVNNELAPNQDKKRALEIDFKLKEFWFELTRILIKSVSTENKEQFLASLYFFMKSHNEDFLKYGFVYVGPMITSSGITMSYHVYNEMPFNIWCNIVAAALAEEGLVFIVDKQHEDDTYYGLTEKGIKHVESTGFVYKEGMTTDELIEHGKKLADKEIPF